MNRIQRFLLFFFAISILLFSNYSTDSGGVKYFLTVVLLFFAFSPLAWWKKLPQDRLAKNTDFEERVNQKIGGNIQLIRTSQESIAYCMSLYRLRITEILRSYSEICTKYPELEQEDSWVLRLLKDSARYEGPLDDKDEEEAQKTEKEALLAYDKIFCHLFGRYPRSNSVEVVDIQIFLSVYSGACRGILRRLQYFKEIDFATIKIQELIKHYTILLESVGDEYQFTNFLKYHDGGSKVEEIRNRARASFMQIRSLWEEINDLLVSNLLVAAEEKIDVAQFFSELDMFNTLYECFRRRLLKKNETELRKSSIGSVSEKQDSVFKEYYSQQAYFRIFQ